MRDGLSRDKRRLAAGLLFMGLPLAASVVAVFVLGRPSRGRVAPGVPFLVGSGWALVLGAAVVFYRSYAGEPNGEGPGSGASPGERRQGRDPDGSAADREPHR